MANELGLPYDKATRQVEGRKSEKKQAKRYGARLHPMSGAGSIKDDASTDEDLFEFKDALITHMINCHELQKLYVRAAKAGKNPWYVIRFRNGIVLEGYLRKEAQS